MDLRKAIVLIVCTTAALGVLSSPVLAQQKSLKEQLVGSWTFVSSIDTRADGTKNDRWGQNPKGTLMFDANGRYVQIISRSDHPKFAANNSVLGTADENKAVMTGMAVFFGTYAVNEGDKILITHVEGSMYPNATGSEQKRIIMSLNADELTYANVGTVLGGSAVSQWKRVK